MITIYNSNEFSIDEEGTIWASGNAGWFEIRPAVHYQEIYDQMQEGVRLFYDLEDVLSNTKATYRHKVGMGDLFVKVSGRDGSPVVMPYVPDSGEVAYHMLVD